jgi:hypothetical protein
MRATTIEDQAEWAYVTLSISTVRGGGRAVPSWGDLPQVYKDAWISVVGGWPTGEPVSQPAPVDNDGHIAQVITGYQEKVAGLELEVILLKWEMESLIAMKDDYQEMLEKLNRFRELKSELGL